VRVGRLANGLHFGFVFDGDVRVVEERSGQRCRIEGQVFRRAQANLVAIIGQIDKADFGSPNLVVDFGGVQVLPQQRCRFL